MTAQRLLPDLLAAERGLARLDARLADPSRARRHACDAARRSALAIAGLDGTPVAADDLLLALAAPDGVELPRRQGAGMAAGLYRLLLALRTGLGPAAGGMAAEVDGPFRDGRLRAETLAAWSSLAADTRRLLTEAEAVLDDDGADDREPAGSAAEHPAPLVPWTLAWVEELHARWHEIQRGRRPAPWEPRTRDAAHDALAVIDDALAADGGVAGTARALHRLHGLPGFPDAFRPTPADEDERSRSIRRYAAQQADGGWWPQFARIVAPQLLARACRLDGGWLPVAAHWGRDHTGYRLALGRSEEAWTAWMTRLVADAVEVEGARSDAIEARQAGWVAATAAVPRPPRRRSDTLGPTRRQRAGTRRSTGRLPQLLDALWEQPVVSARGVERRLAMTYRSALDLIRDLETAGIVRCVTDRKLDRLWRAAVL